MEATCSSETSVDFQRFTRLCLFWFNHQATVASHQMYYQLCRPGTSISPCHRFSVYDQIEVKSGAVFTEV
jgi:hypothetical protein